MTKITTAALFFLAAGIFTSVTILSAYQILFVIPLAYFCFEALKKKDFKLPASSYWLLAFTIIAAISLLINIDIVPKPSKNFGRLKYFVFAIGGIFVLKAWLKDATDKTKALLVNTFLISIIAAGIVMIYKSTTVLPGDRVRGLTDTMRYGYGTGMILLTILSAILHKDKISSWFNWKLAVAALLFGFIGMYLTQTRGALLGFVSGLPFVLYFHRPKLGIALGVLAVLSIGALGTYYLYGSGNSNSRLLMNKNNKSDSMRRSQWQSAIIATKEKPLLGWGFSNFHTQVKRIKHENDLEQKSYDDAHSHNLFLEIASGTGLIGLFLFLGWLLSWAWESFKAEKIVSALVIPFGVAFIVSSQFEVTFDANNAVMIFFLYSISSGYKYVIKSR